ncbi:hypothetical protein IIC65_06115, partial [Candidatus Sumerlaeota bacterium]|nr:hypothetical protein [Candidatus Sumerlaeota bacterium]
LFQLVNDQVSVLRFGSRSLEHCDESAVKDRLGVTPAQVPDWLALVGDSPDNIPGVPPIGSKGAARLLAEFDSLEDLINRADAIKNERQRKSLLENVDQARLSKRLATVVRDVPLSWDAEACRLPGTLWSDEAIKLLAELGFDTIIKEKGLKLPEDFGEAQGIVKAS